MECATIISEACDLSMDPLEQSVGGFQEDLVLAWLYGNN
jgi:hypothetical protein